MQTKKSIWDNKKLVETLEKGGVVVMPTDTIYGIAGKAQDLITVEHIYALRKRSPNKPCIILIGDINELDKFSITLSEEQKNVIKNFSLPTSFILDCPLEEFAYLHRGTKTLAFRIPLNEDLRKLLIQTGPLVAPSANPEGLSPAKSIIEAKKYFGDSVDLYIDGGNITNKASKILKLNKDGTVIVIRE
ncbi:MAG: L-threonylcarbamoyladenylate synthase [Candidatus Paceibacterota bacterium]